MSTTTTDLVPAAGRSRLTPLYDAAVALAMREGTFRSALVAAVVLESPRRVLEVGSGTGSLALRLGAAPPGAEVTGVEPDREVRERAQRKDRDGRVRWVDARADALPAGDATVDAVVFSLVLHHLTDAAKIAALGEARRVLRDDGSLHVADWGRPQGVFAAAGFTALRALDGFATAAAHAEGRLDELITPAGFGPSTRYRRLQTAWGTLELLRATPSTSK